MLKLGNRLLAVVLAGGIFLSFSPPGRAKTVTLTAVSNCMVKASSPNTAFFNAPAMTAYKNTLDDQQYFFWEFHLPADCRADTIDAATMIYRLVLETKRLTEPAVSRAAYFYAIDDEDEIAAGDLSTWTFLTAPGINPAIVPASGNSTPANGNEAKVVGYGTPIAVEGGEWTYTPAGSYLTYLQTHLPNDTNGRLVFLYIPRYLTTTGDVWAGIENPIHHGPQITISYVSNGQGLGVTLEESDGSTVVYEQGSTADTYTVVLDEVPEYDVQITISSDGLTDVSPAQLTFTQDNWNIPRTITVMATDDLINQSPDLYYSVISHAIVSQDAYYNAMSISDLIVTVYDNEGPCPAAQYIPEDLVPDCRINIDDLFSLAAEWMTCTDPARPDICESYPEGEQ